MLPSWIERRRRSPTLTYILPQTPIGDPTDLRLHIDSGTRCDAERTPLEEIEPDSQSSRCALHCKGDLSRFM